MRHSRVVAVHHIEFNIEFENIELENLGLDFESNIELNIKTNFESNIEFNIASLTRRVFSSLQHP